MLQRQARPKRKSNKSRLLNNNTNDDCKGFSINNLLNKLSSLVSSLLLDIKYTRFGKALLNSIPVLSIFVLLGIIGYTIISPSNIADLISLGLLNTISNSNNEVYAADSTSNTSSLTIDNGNLDNVSNTTDGNMIYSSHTVQVVANNIEGYTLKISGPTDLSGNTAISGADNKTPANMANNTWGYAWTDNTTANNDSLYYQSFDNNKDQVLSSSSSVSSVDFTNKLVFAAKFDQNAAEGHYRANVKLNLAVTPKTLIIYSVHYAMNGGSGGPSNASGVIGGASYTYTIPTTKPTKTGYKLEGYSDNNSAVAKYQPGNTITLNSTTSSVTLYAIWKLTEFPSSLTTMQGMTPEICDSVATGVSKTLTDSGRGNTQYTVRKLTDGNCWMVDNLKLNIRSYTLSSSNTDLASGVSFSSSSAILSNNTSTWSNADNTAIVYSTSPTAISSSSSYNTNYGYYYSWCAATAGTCSSVTSEGADASSSICPKGWRLPTGGDSGDFQTLYSKYTPASGWLTLNGVNGKWLGASTASAGGAFFSVTGRFLSNGLNFTGLYGDYWSRTVVNNSISYNLTLASSNVNPANSNGRYSGLPVRCIAYSS